MRLTPLILTSALALGCSATPEPKADESTQTAEPKASGETFIPTDEPTDAKPDAEGESAESPAPSDASSQPRIDLKVEGADLADVLETIGRKVKRDLVLDTGVQETVSVNLENIPWKEAVGVIAQMTRCEIEWSERGALLRQPPRISVSHVPSDARRTLSLLAMYLGHEVALHADVRGTLPATLEIKDMLVTDALDLITGSIEATWAIKDNTLYAGPPDWVRARTQ